MTAEAPESVSMQQQEQTQQMREPLLPAAPSFTLVLPSVLLNSFIKIQSMYSSPVQSVQSSVIFHLFADTYNHHYHQLQMIFSEFYHPKR